jgi:hypothetical protein
MAEQSAVRGKGPLKIKFTDGSAQHDRIPAAVRGVIVMDVLKNQSRSYDLAKIPAAVGAQLIAEAISKRVKVYVSNHAKNGLAVNEASDQIFADLVAGKLYSRSAGGPRGRLFEPEIWIRAHQILRAAQERNGVKLPNGRPIKPWDAKTEQDMAAKLVAMDPALRKQKQKDWKSKPAFMAALYQAKSELSDDDEDDDEVLSV